MRKLLALSFILSLLTYFLIFQLTKCYWCDWFCIGTISLGIFLSYSLLLFGLVSIYFIRNQNFFPSLFENIFTQEELGKIEKSKNWIGGWGAVTEDNSMKIIISLLGFLFVYGGIQFTATSSHCLGYCKYDYSIKLNYLDEVAYIREVRVEKGNNGSVYKITYTENKTDSTLTGSIWIAKKAEAALINVNETPEQLIPNWDTHEILNENIDVVAMQTLDDFLKNSKLLTNNQNKDLE